jgi:hypothetical protein
VKQSPGHDADHDPEDDPLGTGVRNRLRHARMVAGWRRPSPPPLAKAAEKKAPGTAQVPGGRRTWTVSGSDWTNVPEEPSRGRRLASVPPPTSSGAGVAPTPWPAGGANNRGVIFWGQCRFDCRLQGEKTGTKASQFTQTSAHANDSWMTRWIGKIGLKRV